MARKVIIIKMKLSFIRYIGISHTNASFQYNVSNDQVNNLILDVPITHYGFVENSGVVIQLVKEFSKRNIDVGRSLALLTLELSQSITLYNAISPRQEQDNNCKQHISNWDEIAAKRDEWLEKIKLLE